MLSRLGSGKVFASLVRATLVGAFLLAAFAPLQDATATAIELAIIAHPSSGQQAIDKPTLRSVFTGRMKVWPNGVPIARLQSPPKDPLRVEFDRAVLGMSPDEAAKFWIDALVRGQTQPPRVLATSAIMGQVVIALQGAIGYVPRASVPKGVVVVAIVTNGQVSEP